MATDSYDIPQVNPGASYLRMAQDIQAAIGRVLDSGRYILGDEVAGFEAEFAQWLGAGHAVGCASGTDALVLALRALGIGPGCAVATVSHTAVATVAAIELVGATPVLIDIDPDHYTLDADELRAVLASPPPGCPPIRAVIPVHIYGQAADLEPILEVCADWGLVLIEDCAQAHGATYRGRKVGTFGDAATFSFYPTKNLGGFGDGGLTSFRSDEVAERARGLRQYGWRGHAVSSEPGMNSRLDEIQAAILRVKLVDLDAANARREQIADAYDRALALLAVTPPVRRADSRHAFHQYVMRVNERDRFRVRLSEQGLSTGIHYQVPVHRQPGYAGRILLGPNGCKTTERIADEIVSLPLYPELTEDQLAYICGILQQTLGEAAFAIHDRPAKMTRSAAV